MKMVHPREGFLVRRLPPLTALRAFEAAARGLSFKDAADELGLTPTAISHQIRLLELHCGKPLFRRRPRPLSLTQAGVILFPAIRAGLDRFAEGLAAISDVGAGALRVTVTNEFAARWLMPRLPSWRSSQPDIRLDIVGTSKVLDIEADEADIAIRYSRMMPTGCLASELLRDSYCVVASPRLVGAASCELSPRQLASFPLIDSQWPPSAWREWVVAARSRYSDVPDLSALASLSFDQDLHIIEAAIAGQGIAICSDVLIADAVNDNSLRLVSSIELPGCGFYSIHRAGHPKIKMIEAFDAWIRAEI